MPNLSRRRFFGLMAAAPAAAVVAPAAVSARGGVTAEQWKAEAYDRWRAMVNSFVPQRYPWIDTAYGEVEVTGQATVVRGVAKRCLDHRQDEEFMTWFNEPLADSTYDKEGRRVG